MILSWRLGLRKLHKRDSSGKGLFFHRMPVLLTEEEIAQKLPSASGWDRQGAEITRQLKFTDFMEAMRFVNRVADLAEKANHHPDIDIRWNKVLLRLSHSKGGLTELDLALAAEINRCAS
jgi:4a-hydroxytetrahydrobiopterin dehydratase